jgi:hypothetical protein
VASHQLIDDYLAELGRRLPANAVDELTDGLIETWRHHLAAGLPAARAAQAAIAEFGTSEEVTTAFVTQSPDRRTAVALLASGPLVGACWGASLTVGRAWTWPVPAPVAAVFGATLLAVVAALVSAATSRHSYRRARLGALGGLGLVALDAAMLFAVLFAAPRIVWPMAAAIAASLARIALTLRSLTTSIAFLINALTPGQR